MNRFVDHTRPSHLATYGEQAPEADPYRPYKPWRDDSLDGLPGEELVNYQCLNMQTGEVETFTLPVWQARTVNLPGAYEYPRWIPQPTEAVLVMGPQTFPIEPYTLSTREQAEEIAAAIGGIVHLPVLGMVGYEWRGETRRPYQIAYGDRGSNAGRLIQQQYQMGVGHPGSWSVDSRGAVWTPGKTPTETGPGTVPTPIRPLQPGERIERGFGGIWRIVKDAPRTVEDRLGDIERRIEQLEARDATR
jgi:hypothetical protein